MICVIDHKNTHIRYQAGCLHIRYNKQGRKQAPLPINQLEQVIVYGNPVVETTVWRKLAEAGVVVVMLAARGKPEAAMLGSGLAVRLPLRRMQHRIADDSGKSVAMARWFVAGKFRSYLLPLDSLVRLYKPDMGDEEQFRQRLDRAGNQLDQATTVSELMGIEGRLARAWFRLLAKALPAKFHFTGRNRRPPLDPVNSLLSLGYTMLLSEVRQILLCEGFDPSLGFLHQEHPGREALALDFLEIFRAGIDDFILNWLHTTPFDKRSFYYRADEGCRLAKATRPLFYQAWAQQREQWPAIFDSMKDRDPVPLRERLLGRTAASRAFMRSISAGGEEQ